MASSSEHGERGYIPPQSDEERLLMRRVEELCRLADARGIPRATGFLSDREQALAAAAMNRAGCDFGRFWGGWDAAERKVLCVEPPDTWVLEPVAVLRLSAFGAQAGKAPGHREYLGALLNLGIERACVGDLLPDPQTPGQMYAFVLQGKADFLAAELSRAGAWTVRAQLCEQVPDRVLAEPDRTLYEASVASLRADAVLASMMHTSRANAAQAIAAGRVELNHLPLRTTHEPVYANDLFTVRGAGRWRLQSIGAPTRKGRIFVTYFQY